MRLAFVLPVFLIATAALAADPVVQPACLAPDSFDFKTLCGEPPADGSPAQQQEIDQLLKFQETRTPADVKRCEEEVAGSAFVFADVLGDSFDEKSLPVTAALMKEVSQQAKVVSGAAKAVWNRARPYTLDSRVKPCIKLETSKSYPSGHAARGMVWGLVLAELYPDQREALTLRGKQFGEDRAIGGVHYPSDVAAGQKVGAEVVKRLLADPDFKAKLEKTRHEVEGHAHVK